MSDEPKVPEHPPEFLVEDVVQADGTRHRVVHGADCERTRQVHAALRRGEQPPHPDSPQAAKCGPAQVATDAYRTGWETIFGKDVEVGQA